jgi:hypothetical protein
MQTESNKTSNFASMSNETDESQGHRLLIPRSQRRKFFILFTLMTLLGWVVGGIASIALEKTILENLAPIFSPEPQIWQTWVRHFSSLVFAVIFGADQALIMRGYLSGWLWMLATSAGWLIASTVSTAWIDYITSIASSLNGNLSPEETVIFGVMSTLSYILSGIWLGFSQWVVLRRYTTSAWWWNFLPSISFFFISILIWMLSLVQDLIPEAYRIQIMYWGGQGLTAVILGAIPAIGLCRLKKNSRHTTGISNSL